MLRPTALLAALLAAAPVLAHEYAVGALVIDHPVITATPPAAPVAGGYLRITNTGDADDVLVSAVADPARTPLVQLHRMALEDGVMRMSEVAGGIPVPAGETVVLERGGLHVMFMQLPRGFSEVGDTLPATLTFRDAGPVDIVFDVEGRGGSDGAAAGGHGRHGD